MFLIKEPRVASFPRLPDVCTLNAQQTVPAGGGAAGRTLLSVPPPAGDGALVPQSGSKCVSREGGGVDFPLTGCPLNSRYISAI